MNLTLISKVNRMIRKILKVTRISRFQDQIQVLEDIQ